MLFELENFYQIILMHMNSAAFPTRITVRIWKYIKHSMGWYVVRYFWLV